MKSSLEPEVQQFVDDLEAVLDGRADLEMFQLTYSGPDVHEIIQDVMGSVWHFLADMEMQTHDVAHREIQLLEMSRLIRLLRAGHLAQARRITFVRPAYD